MKRLTCGVIGAGRVGLMHIENLLSLSTINIVGVSDLFIENSKTYLNDLGIYNLYADYEELLKDDSIEAVFIFSSTDTHEEITIAAARAGKHIFCEKPLSMDLKESASINVLREVTKNNVLLQIGFNRRVDLQFKTIYEQIQAGAIGDPQIVKITSRDPDLLPHDLIKRIGGLLFDFTMHDFDMARYMMQSNIVEVYAKGGTLIDPSLKNIGDVDTLAIVLEFENGAFGLIDNSRRAVYGYDQRVEVFGTKGMLKAENVSESTVELYTAKKQSMKNPLPIFTERYRYAYKEEVNQFVEAVLEGCPLVADGFDVIMAQRVATAAQESLLTGKPVKVDPSLPIIE
ncbi:inositol 2-dehydrogenase [Vagococcus intermedius]|uniref:Inositol 2-dehydrogenase n=1 Tax=Vagococcus intermedius TaxID=2991418 RepID=A0AAF0I605_9ENTE|nr:inositol 2-dehydrogenase [Vagococcus intermedius]WEG72405.1 inositol 2-dehydrogenase [Vagococcus intermedius]WEG74493.1 inositol 2-dehydrogenase [Vagococcus intermedius]